MADLASVRRFSERFNSKYPTLDLLINNAGVMVPPEGKTKDGFELQFGANHLGHFALTGLLIDRLLATPKARVVTVSGGAHRMAKMDFANLQAEKGYEPWEAYGRSKLANLLFTAELQRRFEATGADVVAVAAHPGGAKTNLQSNMSALLRPVMNLIMQEAEMGALPTHSATAAPVQGGDYYGPGGFEIGYPKKVDASAASKDVGIARRLWLAPEALTGVSYTTLDLEGAGVNEATLVDY